MFDRTSAGWNLSKHSWQVLKLDKELILFPLPQKYYAAQLDAPSGVGLTTLGHLRIQHRML